MKVKRWKMESADINERKLNGRGNGAYWGGRSSPRRVCNISEDVSSRNITDIGKRSVSVWISSFVAFCRTCGFVVWEWGVKMLRWLLSLADAACAQ